MIDGVEKAIAEPPADAKVIPGHGDISNLDDVHAYVKMLRATWAVGQDALDKKDVGADEREEDSRNLEEVFRRVRERGCIYRNVVQLANRPEKRHIHQA